MTEKELLYLEDTLLHEKNLEILCSNFTDQVVDLDAKNFIIYLENKYRLHFEIFYKILNL